MADRQNLTSNLHRRVAAVALLGVLIVPTGAARQRTCGGDCNNDDEVTVDEFILGVSIALGTLPLTDCASFDANADGEVTIDELLAGVDNSLNGCRVTPSITATPTRTPHATISPPRSPTLPLQETEAIEGGGRVATTNPAALQIIDFGCVAANCQGHAAPQRFRLAAKRGAASGVALAGPQSCPRGGTRESVCEGETQTVTYVSCIELTDSGHSVVRNGVTKLAVVDRDFCADPVIRPDQDQTRVELLGYRQIERGAGNVVVAEIEASLTDWFSPTRQGCAGPEGEQRVNGSVDLVCTLDAESVSCPQGGTDLLVTARDLVVTRRSGGFPCELGLDLQGGLDVEVDDPIARFVETFDGFLLTETQMQDGSTRIKQNGPLSVECLGPLLFTTRIQDSQEQTGAFVFPSGAACPIDGVLEVRRPPLVASGTFTDGKIVTASSQVGLAAFDSLARSGDGEPADGQLTLAAAQHAMELRHDLFRSANGKVYQVLQNVGSEADLGAEAFRVTTLIGSEAGSVGQCANAAGATSDPQAVAAAESGKAFPPAAVFKSELIEFVSQQPCFNRNANSLNGRVCIGSDCVSGSCVCPQGGNCQSFTIGDGTSLAETTRDIPAGTLAGVPELRDPCSGFAGRAVYAFGASRPTVETRQCDEAPSDGFRLRSGRSIVFVYDTPLATLFNAGFGGFPVDEDGINLIGCNQGPNRVLHLGRADLQSVPAPIVTFLADARVQFDFDGDGSADKVTSAQEQCRIRAPAACQ